MLNLSSVIAAYGLDAETCNIEQLGTGLINQTWKVHSKGDAFVLQQINTAVFKRPADIADNINQINLYLQKTAADYLFISPIALADGRTFLTDQQGRCFRMFPFIKGSHTIDTLNNADEAYEAAKQFGKFTFLLRDFETGKLKYTLRDFHNLPLRFQQFIDACRKAAPDRLEAARDAINLVNSRIDIVDSYQNLMHSKLPLRVIHHDTKISNILFDSQNKGLCVIDLDTVMPGYYISDAGDMLRTYLSPVNEEEIDLDKIEIRTDVFEAIYTGYMEFMGNALTVNEKMHFLFSGKCMIYLQAIRFITDYLNNDIYYQTTYPDHNLIRARNQLTLLERFIQKEAKLSQLMRSK